MTFFEKFFSSGSSAGLGLDLGSSTIKTAQLVKSFGKKKIAKFETCPTPPDAFNKEGVIMNPQSVADAVKNLLHAANLEEKAVVTAVSGPSVITRTLEMAPMSRQELKKSLQFEAERYLPYSAADAQVDGVILRNAAPGKEETMEVLLVAAPKEMVSGIEEAVKLAGLELKAVELETVAIHRVLPLVLDSQALRQTTAVINVGASCSSAHIYQEGFIRGSRSIPIAGNHFTRGISEKMSLDFSEAEILKREKGMIRVESDSTPVSPEAMQIFHAVLPFLSELTTELQRFFDFYHSRGKGETIDRIYVSGGSARLKNLDLYFSEAFGLPVEMVSPGEKLGQGGVSNQDREHPGKLLPESLVVSGLSAWFVP